MAGRHFERPLLARRRVDDDGLRRRQHEAAVEAQRGVPRERDGPAGAKAKLVGPVDRNGSRLDVQPAEKQVVPGTDKRQRAGSRLG
jgi:hypothetical protein